jgi:HPt (histidine-containing phosphotransfer) domain-containing protein
MNQAAENGALPTLPGLDIPLGLSHVGNNQAFYFQLLERFRNSQRPTVGELRRECEANLQLEARRRVHSLRGVAANIGALDLQNRAGELETFFKTHNIYNLRHPELLKRVQALDAALTVLLDGLDHYHATAPVAAEVVAPPDPKKNGEEAVTELCVLLKADRADAVFLFDKVRASLASLYDEATLLKVASSVRQFDFVGALRLLGRD